MKDTERRYKEMAREHKRVMLEALEAFDPEKDNLEEHLKTCSAKIYEHYQGLADLTFMYGLPEHLFPPVMGLMDHPWIKDPRETDEDANG